MSVTLSVATRYSFADGHEFGPTGAYEYLAGRALFAVDPKAPDLQAVTDLGLAPVNKDGKVEFSADFALLKPVDLKRGNQRLFFDYGNRGNKRCLQFFNDAVGASEPRTLEHAGNGFFMRRGYTVGWLAWQGDLHPGEGRMLIDVPVATDNGKPVTGPVRVEYIAVEQGVQCMPLSGQAAARSYPAASRDTRQARLTRRRYADSERVAIPAEAWQFARVEFGTTVDGGGRERAVIPCDTHLYIEAGFEPGWIYELIYTGRDPLVLGLGHVAVRDFVSYVKHEAGAGNPLAGGVDKAYAWGRSQTGRCIRDFVYLGFNADAKGRKAFDGVIPHVAGGGKMWMNQRFAAIMPLPGQEYENHFTPVDVFPFSYATTTDHLTGRKDGIAKRPSTDPLIIQTDTATEYWQRRGSLTITDTEGNDVALPANVRVYLWASTQHYADPLMKQPSRGICVYPANVVWSSMLFRATLDMMDRWASGKGEPPPSKIPSRKDGTLVTAEEWRKRYPAIPGAIVPRGPSKCELLDFGPDVERGLLQEPPVVHKEKRYVVQVPVTDSDGNDVPGIRAPMVQAPLATYNGWSMRAPGHGYGAMGPIVGSTILFAETPEARAASGDPRPSILERYKDKAAYVAAIEAAAKKLVAEGFMLEEDVARSKTLAADWGRPRHEVKLP